MTSGAFLKLASHLQPQHHLRQRRTLLSEDRLPHQQLESSIKKCVINTRNHPGNARKAFTRRIQSEVFMASKAKGKWRSGRNPLIVIYIGYYQYLVNTLPYTSVPPLLPEITKRLILLSFIFYPACPCWKHSAISFPPTAIPANLKKHPPRGGGRACSLAGGATLAYKT